MQLKQERGFSLIELLMVVTIMGILSVIAFPVLHRARQRAQAASAVQALRTVGSGQLLYERKHSTYGTFAQLLSENVLDPALTTGTRSDYLFNLVVAGTGKTYTITATPLVDATQSDYFFMDTTGVIRFNKGSAADVSSPPIPR
jgi:prepilin-type N-terminal cleavage/methylation domain-containing protein